MKFNLFKAFVFISLVINGYTWAQQKRPVDYVDPFIGSEGEGNVFVGAALPFGMVKLGPDCKGHSNSGYISGGKIEGFSHTHVSGTGGGAKYGNILVKPWVGEIDLNDEGTNHSNEKASAGYYSVFLEKQKVLTELTVSHNTGFHQYTFPKTEKASILIDAGHFLFFGYQWGEAQELVGSEIRILSATEAEGYCRVRHGWNFGGPYTVYFYAKFEKSAVSFGSWRENKIYPGVSAQPDKGDKTGAYFAFRTENQEKIRLKVGISFISSLKAKQNLEKSIPAWDFNKVQKDASDKWNDIVSKISVEATDDQKKILYTSLYHVYLMPVDRTGENPKWKSTAPYYDDYYAIWDTYRTPHPLMTILTPDRQIDIINSLLDIYKFEGFIPDARSGNDNGRTQGGSDADIMIHDAYIKGLKGIDYEQVLKAMLKNAEVAPGNDERKEGRGGLTDYKSLGYISTNYERAGSRTLEYAYCDFCIAGLAKGLGHNEISEKYFKKANNWLNLWDSNFESHHTKGFIMPKKANGEWHKNFAISQRAADGGKTEYFNEFTFGYWEAFFYESNSWEYSFFVPHDVKKLIEVCGGRETFINRLDTFFTNGYFQVSNEPGFLTPYLYSWAGRHDKVAEGIKRILGKHYHAGRNGIPGNDDSGAMGAWFVFSALGFFPNAGQDVYLAGVPLFKKATIKLPDGKEFNIIAKNLSDKNIYVKSAKLNGTLLDKAWIKHTDIVNGGILEFEMGNKPTDWGSKILPPSLSDSK